MGSIRLEILKEQRRMLEEAYTKITGEIKRELLINALVDLKETVGVVQFLDSQSLQDNVAKENDIPRDFTS